MELNGKKLTRSHDTMLGGVCAGIAEYFGVDPTVVRVIYVLMFFFLGVGFLVYLACWLVIPKKQIGQ